ncbi:MAG: site-specific integrase [Myxococcaceae bacterium]|nr:MAG: site-specific integrase [Myxococcaceae bacterium]
MRRTAGSGSIDQLASGRFRVRMTFSDGSRKNLGPYTTREEAERMLNASLAELADAGLAPTGAETLLTWGDTWLDRRENSGVHRAIATERSTWKNHIATAPFASWPLADITRREVRDWVETLSRKKAMAPAAWKTGKPRRTTRTLSRQSVVHALNLLRKCLADAIDDDRLSGDNPARDVRVPKKHTTQDAWTYLTADEIQHLLSTDAVPQAARQLFTVAIYTGLRQGELWGLCWTDVHLDGPQPHLVVRYSHKGPTKSGKIRHVPLLAPARAALRSWKDHCPKSVGGLVFPTVTGCRRRKSDEAGWRDRHITKVVIEPGFKTLAGITRRVRFHDLRHTCASHLVMGTWGRAWRIEEVCALLGHSEIGVTQRYAHLSPDHLHRAAAETVLVAPPRRSREGHEPKNQGLGIGENFFVFASERATGIEPATFSLGS